MKLLVVSLMLWLASKLLRSLSQAITATRRFSRLYKISRARKLRGRGVN
jgi:hypothetical protein